MKDRARAALGLGPYAAHNLVAMGIFATESGATRFLTTLHERKEVSFFGRFRPFGGTKPRHYYTSADVKKDAGLHEVLISEVHSLLAPRLKELRRGPGEVDPEVLQDFVAVFEKKAEGGADALQEACYDGELDRSTMTAGRMYRQRFCHYIGSDRPLLVVTSGGEQRMRNLMRVAEELEDIAYFTTLGRLRKDPFGEIWSCLDGETYALDV